MNSDLNATFVKRTSVRSDRGDRIHYYTSVTIIERSIIGLFTGLVGGAIFGVAVFIALFLPGYLAGHSFFNKLEYLVLFAAWIGGLEGLIVGGVIGLIVSAFALRKLYAALSGVFVILTLALYLVGPPASFDKAQAIITILALPSAAALGVIVVAVINWFHRRRTNSPGPSREEF